VKFLRASRVHHQSILVKVMTQEFEFFFVMCISSWLNSIRIRITKPFSVDLMASRLLNLR
jgi:hypothetical protein